MKRIFLGTILLGTVAAAAAAQSAPAARTVACRYPATRSPRAPAAPGCSPMALSRRPPLVDAGSLIGGQPSSLALRAEDAKGAQDDNTLHRRDLTHVAPVESLTLPGRGG